MMAFVGWAITIGGLVVLVYAWLSESGGHDNDPYDEYEAP